MLSLSNLRLLPLSILLVVGLSSSVLAQEKAKLKKATVTEKTTDDEEEEESKGLEIGKLLPLNKPNLRVKIPGFDKGELASMVEAEKLTRIDDTNLRLEEATIQLIPQALLIKLRTALYNTEGSVLSSNETTTLSSKEFTMTGAAMDFDTASGKGQMKGPVKMIIHNVKDMSGPEKKPTATTKTTVPARTATKEIPAK